MAWQIGHHRNDDEYLRLLAMQLDQLRTFFPWRIVSGLLFPPDTVTTVLTADVVALPASFPIGIQYHSVRNSALASGVTTLVGST